MIDSVGQGMQKLLFNELRECNRYIRAVTSEAEREAGSELIIKTIGDMRHLSNVARKEGLLSLEEAAAEMESMHQGEMLKMMILLIVDGTDPVLVDEICGLRFFADDLKGFDALQYILMARAALAIQAGQNPRVIDELMISAIPEYIRERYRAKKKEKEAKGDEWF